MKREKNDENERKSGKAALARMNYANQQDFFATAAFAAIKKDIKHRSVKAQTLKSVTGSCAVAGSHAMWQMYFPDNFPPSFHRPAPRAQR